MSFEVYNIIDLFESISCGDGVMYGFDNAEQLAKERVDCILNELKELRQAQPNCDFILLDDRHYIITKLRNKKSLIVMSLMTNDGIELTKIISPEKLDVAIEEVVKH